MALFWLKRIVNKAIIKAASSMDSPVLKEASAVKLPPFLSEELKGKENKKKEAILKSGCLETVSTLTAVGSNLGLEEVIVIVLPIFIE